MAEAFAGAVPTFETIGANRSGPDAADPLQGAKAAVFPRAFSPRAARPGVFVFFAAEPMDAPGEGRASPPERPQAGAGVASS